MTRPKPLEVEEVLSSFAETVSGVLFEHHQKQLANLDLTLPQAQALKILRGGACPTGVLAAQLRISAPAVTQLTDRLLRKGLIERQAAANDRRSVIVALSERGRQLVAQFRRQRGLLFDEALKQLDESEQAQVLEALRKVSELLVTNQSDGVKC